jgi:hypothetical protein
MRVRAPAGMFGQALCAEGLGFPNAPGGANARTGLDPFLVCDDDGPVTARETCTGGDVTNLRCCTCFIRDWPRPLAGVF